MPYYDPSLPRGGIERAFNRKLYEIAEAMIPPPEEAREEDLRFLRNYTPVVWFGGAFPALGVQIKRKRGKPSRVDVSRAPGVLEVEFVVYFPALTNYERMDYVDDESGLLLDEHGEPYPPELQPTDASGEAKRITEDVRDRYLDALTGDADLSPYLDLASIDTWAGTRDELGIAYLANQERDVLWLDQTRFDFRL